MVNKTLCTRMMFLFSLASAAGANIAVSQSNDFFPLAVGNQWTYRYWWQHIEYYNSITDTGTATCYIYSKTSSNDSVLWSFQETRDIVRLYGHSPYDPPDSTRAIIDSSRFSLLEMDIGDHALSIVGSSTVFLLGTGYNRYYSSDPDDTVLVRTGNGHNLWNNIILQRLTGPIDFSYTFYGAHIGTSAHHTLSSAFITSAPQTQERGSPVGFILSQNYPNPFNPATTIKYVVPERSRVVLKVFDILGREVVTLADADRNAGTYFQAFIATSLTSGVYFCRLESSRVTFTKKMILEK